MMLTFTFTFSYNVHCSLFTFTLLLVIMFTVHCSLSLFIMIFTFTFSTMKGCFHPHTLTVMLTFTFTFSYNVHCSLFTFTFHHYIHFHFSSWRVAFIPTHSRWCSPTARFLAVASSAQPQPLLQCHHPISLLIFGPQRNLWNPVELRFGSTIPTRLGMNAKYRKERIHSSKSLL